MAHLEVCEGTWAEQVRMRQLMEQYRDTPMDLADASLPPLRSSI